VTTQQPPAIHLDGKVTLDWRQAKVAPARRMCVSCFGPTFLLDPADGRPRHKTCAESEAEADRAHALGRYGRA
jgi:hypothetical protein